MADEKPDESEPLLRRSILAEQAEQELSFLDSDDMTSATTANFPPKSAGNPVLVAPESGQPHSLGRYRLIEAVGRGAFGEVWKAFDPLLNRIVAIKAMRRDRPHAQGEQKFLEEGRKLAQLVHPGVVAVHDVGFDGESAFIVSQFIEGETLDAQFRRGSLQLRRAIEIVISVAEAAHAAHLRGIVHRDIKPSNILLDGAGKPVLADFGIAATEEDQLTEAPSISGTLPYMSPEQIRGESHLVDARSDVYSLGVVLYQLLTGRLPFVASNLSEFRKLVGVRYPRPLRTINDRLPAQLEQVCLKALSPQIMDRYMTALDFAEALRDCAPENPAAPSTSPAFTTKSFPMGKWLVGGMTALLVYLLVTIWLPNLLKPRAKPDSAAHTPPSIQRQVEPPTRLASAKQQLLADPPVELVHDRTTVWEHDSRSELLRITAKNRSSFIGIGQASGPDYQVEMTLQLDPLENSPGLTNAYLILGARPAGSVDSSTMKWTGQALIMCAGDVETSGKLILCDINLNRAQGQDGVSLNYNEIRVVKADLSLGRTFHLKSRVGSTGVSQVWIDHVLVLDHPSTIGRFASPGTPLLLGQQLGIIANYGTLSVGNCTLKPLEPE